MHVVVSQRELARRAGVSAMAISKAVASGRLNRGPGGIDLQARKTIDYLATAKHQRRSGKRQKVGRRASGKSEAKTKHPVAQSQSGKKRQGKTRAEVPEGGGPLEIDGETYAMAELRKLKGQADKEEQQNAIRRGELVERRDVHRIFARLYQIHTSQLKTLADKLGPDMAAALGAKDADTLRVQELMDLEVRRALAQMKKEMQEYLDAIRDGKIGE